MAGLGAFFGLSMLPMLLPAAMETVKPGITSVIMEPFYRFFKKYGHWAAVIILFALGGMYWRGALIVIP